MWSGLCFDRRVRSGSALRGRLAEAQSIARLSDGDGHFSCRPEMDSHRVHAQCGLTACYSVPPRGQLHLVLRHSGAESRRIG